MKRALMIPLAVVSLAFISSGCVVRTYKVTRDRVDQDLTAGNRGYLQGDSPAIDESARKTQRTTHVVEVELHSPLRFEKAPKARPAGGIEDREIWGNRGYVGQNYTPQAYEPAAEEGRAQEMASYTVQKGDTLQKISRKFYGTTKKWRNIYEANAAVLKGPDKIYPGQVLSIPAIDKVQALAEPEENLK